MLRPPLLTACAAAVLGAAALVAAQPETRPPGPVAAIPGELQSYATLHSLGFEWHLTGDSDHDAACKVQYREKGARGWKEALPLFRVDFYGWYAETKADRPYNMLAGSIMFLKPDTAYEVKLDLSDPDGGAASRTLEVRTRPEPRPEGTRARGRRTLHVVPGAGGGEGSARNPFQGLAAAQAAARPGDVVLLHKGSYGSFTFNKAGEPGKYLVWKTAGDGEAVLDFADLEASHVWLEGLTFRFASNKNGLRARGAPADVVVRGNSFTGFHYSVFLSPSSEGWYIADNVISGDNDPASNSIDGEGIELNKSSGHTVCYNRITRTADGVSYPKRNCDIFGNDIHDVSDDGLEPDYGYANVRMWNNRITNVSNNSLSFQPQYCGPWYFIRNQVVGGNMSFKFRVQDRFVLVNNTFVNWGSIGNRMHHILTSLSRNNLYILAGGRGPVWVAHDCNEPRYCLPNNYAPDWRTDVDYDGFDWGDAPTAFRWENSKMFPDLASFAQAVGIERHGIRVRKEAIFANWSIPAAEGRVSPHDLTLKLGSNAIDAGAALPNLTGDFVGKAPDLGALESGKSVPDYGPRGELRNRR
jgi:hypothetical protein